MRSTCCCFCCSSGSPATLTLLGFQYALSSGGLYLGREILGSFYLKTRGLPREKAIEIAKSHFKPYASVVRPVLSISTDFKRHTDGWIFLRVWKRSESMGTGRPHTIQRADTHGYCSHADSTATFSSFLDSSFPRIETRTGRISHDRFELSPESHMMEWPETTFDPTE